ncbi:hypothetical protein [Nocardia fluminea]|uniref:Uncharacterized protein n=1 Tax=Nocardia fluminea TaxID=134984 RepID=A0A2N3VGY1_9NOCA|nr:hypothetical protein [Nocardia fluminea]PKV80881.1 hypothetical protein ATK86_5318 [Nocardia fluminea]
MSIENLLRLHGHDTTTRELPDGKLAFDPKDPPVTAEPATFTPTAEDVDATVDLWRRKLATADGSGGLDDVIALATLAYATVPFLLDGLDATRARIAELEAADREHSQTIEYLHHTHGIDIDREHADFREWQRQYGEVTDRG